MLKYMLYVGIGGAVGSIVRYLTHLVFTRFQVQTFPVATLMVNSIGCFLIGLLMNISGRPSWLEHDIKLLLVTGFCGGLTTFSTFSYENIQMLQQGNTTGFISYSIISYAGGLAAVYAGILVGKAG